jgi:hypothetical protein
VFENRVLRIFGPRRDAVTGDWRKLHNEELCNLYPSPNIIRMIKPRRMRWTGHVARMGDRQNAYRIFVGKPEGKRPLKEQDIRGWTIQKWILERQDGMVWIALIWLRIGASGGLL